MATYPVNKTHRQVLEDQVRSPWIHTATVKAEGASCEKTGDYMPVGTRCWRVQDVGLFRECPTDDEVREVARAKLEELDRLGISTEYIPRGPGGLI